MAPTSGSGVWGVAQPGAIRSCRGTQGIFANFHKKFSTFILRLDGELTM